MNRTADILLFTGLLSLFSGLGCGDAYTFREGERLYSANCANCHMDDGVGLSALIPPLAGSDYLVEHRERLPCILRHGLRDSIRVNGKLFNEQMPGVPTLSDIQVTNLLNYINNSWGNRNGAFRLDEVRTALGKCRK